jgi:hypothetical protein
MIFQIAVLEVLWHELCFILHENLKKKSIHTKEQQHEPKTSIQKYPF